MIPPVGELAVTLVSAAAGIAVLAIAARRAWLAPSGVGTAAVVGVLVVWGLGPPALAMLMFFFVTSSALTRFLRPAAFEGADSDAGGRLGGQVLANAGVAAAAAVAARLLSPHVPWEAAFAGALAAATADTWASEVGEWRRATTRLITSWRRVDPGVDGGVSWPGSIAAAAAALAVAALGAVAFDAPSLLWPVALGGMAGTTVDSLAGALVEGRRPWLANDTINWLATATGAVVALLTV